VSATKEIEAVGQEDRQRIVANILALAMIHAPSGTKNAGQRDRYRMRVGRYQIVYSIADDELVVLIVRVADRRISPDRQPRCARR
jgi:mRNA interferase RelE/StbE